MTDGERPQFASPCAACRALRRRCVENCVLAPYFPPNNPHKFAIAHKVFGASNIIKSIQVLPEERRDDAVNSMVYEASARLHDPVYGCAGIICHLQQQISDLQTQLSMAQAEALKMHSQLANLVAFISRFGGSASAADPIFDPDSKFKHVNVNDDRCKYNQVNDAQLDIAVPYIELETPQEWEPLWTMDINRKDE